MSYDLETLRLIGWALLGLIALGLAVGEGISLGALMLLPWSGDTQTGRCAVTHVVAPVGLVNLAWLVVMVTVLFAAWPVAYAVALASFQPLLFVMLLALLLRPLALYFIDADLHPDWRRYGRKALTLSGWLPAALLGLIAGNLLKGIPFHLESDMRIVFLGDVTSFTNPFALLVSANCLALLAMHGACYLQLQTSGDPRRRAGAMQLRAGLGFLLLFALAGLWITHLEGYHVSSDLLPNADSNPLGKFVKRGEGLWLDNYEHVPALSVIPALAAVGAVASLWLGKLGRYYPAMLASSISVAMTTLTVGVSMFPFLLPSNLSLNSSLTIWDSSASSTSLQALFTITAFALPLIFLYNRWVFRLFGAKPG